jgi:Protein of unknown function (DUF4242)
MGRPPDVPVESMRRSSDRKEDPMALFMDSHAIDGGVKAIDVAQAHLADLQTQDRYGVRYLRYWVDEGAGRIFCLVDAPDAEAAIRVHREAHGLVADSIHQVVEGF